MADGSESKEATGKYGSVKQAILQAINATRAEAGVGPVELDNSLSAAADAHCEEMVSYAFTGHMGLNGFKPYQRYFFGAGCRHHVVENVGGAESGDRKWDTEDASVVLAQATAVRDSFMAGSGPAEVYASNTVHAAHTHVGIGIAITQTSFRLVEVYSDQYVTVMDTTPEGEAAPALEFTSDETQLIVKSNRPDVDVVACSVFYEPQPQAVAPEQAGRVTSYDDFTHDKAAVVWPWEMTRLSNKALRIPIFLSPLRPGHYYVQVHVRGDVGSIPYSAPSEDLDITAQDVFVATGLVLTCTAEQAMAFEEAQRAAETQAADDMSDGGDGAGVEAFSEIAVVRSSDPTPAGFRRQQLHELGSFGAGVPAAVGVAGGDVGVHLCMSPNPSLPAITHLVTVTSDSGRSQPAAPQGYELVPVNIAALITGDTDVSPAVWLAVKRASGEEGAEDVPVLDAALAAFGDGSVPPGYDATPSEVQLGPDGSAVVLLCQTVDADAAGSAAEASNEAIRARVTGFDAPGAGGDGLDWQEVGDDLEFDDPAAEEARRAEERARVYQMLQEVKAERGALMNDNVALQRQLAAVFASRQPEDDKADKSGDGDTAAMREEKGKRYRDTLGGVIRAKDDLVATQSHYDAIAMELQARLDEKEAKASEIQDSFIDFKREIAKAAENSRTGKPIPRRIIKQFEATEAAKDQEVEKVRLKNIHLRTHLRKLEARLKEKEQLADGLHLIDFEQLKIENQTLNEKIEERHEELHKLRKKTTTTVQVLTHIKEKLQFVQARAAVLKTDLGNLEEQVTQQRDSLNRAKRERDNLRSENDRLRQQQGFVNNDMLVLDFEKRKNKMKGLREEAEELRRQYAFLTAQTQRGTSAQ